jgi:hypothetical protein
MNPTNKSAIAPTAATSKKVRRMLGLSLHDWENSMILFLIIAGFFGLIAGAATWAVVQRIELAQSQKELEEYKLTVEGKVADAKKEGIEAGKTAGDALLRAAELEKEAASSRLETEKIKGVVGWRTIKPEVASELERALAANPGSVNLRFMDGDPEALFLAIQFSQVFSKAHWQIAPGALKPANAIVFGIGLPDSSGTDAQRLRAAFTAAGIEFSPNPVPRAQPSQFQ